MLTLLLAIVLSQSAQAGKVKLGSATVGGSGCPSANSVNFTISPDDSALSVLFDQMVVQAGGELGRREETKTCSFSLAIALPPGMALSVAQVDYRGYALGSKQNIFNHMSSDYYLDDKPARHFEHKFKGPVNDLFAFSEVIPMRERHKSNCSGKLKLNVGTRITTRTNPQGDASMVALDSLDAASRKGGIIYSLALEPCR